MYHLCWRAVSIRRTSSLTELVSKSATNAEIVSCSGYAVNSPILQDYVMQTKEAALNARRKMGSKFMGVNETGILVDLVGQQIGGSDGTRTRGLRRDRPAL